MLEQLVRAVKKKYPELKIKGACLALRANSHKNHLAPDSIFTSANFFVIDLAGNVYASKINVLDAAKSNESCLDISLKKFYNTKVKKRRSFLENYFTVKYGEFSGDYTVDEFLENPAFPTRNSYLTALIRQDKH